MKKIKSIAFGILLAAVLTTSSVSANAALSKIQAYLNTDVSVVYNGERVDLQSAPITYNGKTYVAVSDIGKITDSNVSWNQKSKTIGINKESGKRVITPDSIYSKYGFKKVYTIGDKEYVNFIVLNEVLMNYGLKFRPVQDVAINLIDNEGNIVLENVKFEYVLNDMAIDYQYFLNEILPLGKAE